MARNRYFEDEELEHINGKTLSRLLGELKIYKKQLISSLLLMAGAAAANILGPYLTKIAIDDYMIPGDYSGILFIAGLYGLLQVANAVFLRYRLLIMVTMGNRFIAEFRERVFTHVHSLSFKYFDDRPAGKIITRIMNNVDRLQQMVKHGIVNVITDILKLIVLLVFMFVLNFKLAAFSLMLSPLLIFFIFFIRKHIRRSWQSVQSKLSNLNAWIHESFTGIKVIQAFVREDINSGIMDEQLGDNYKSWIRAVVTSSTLFPTILVFNFTSIALVYFFGYHYLRDGLISLGMLVAFSQYVWMISEPIVNLSNFYNEILVGLSAAERVYEVLDTPVEIKEKEDAEDLPSLKGHLKFDNVFFGYDPAVPILKDMNFEVKPGETIALVGETGAGKSTIINLLSRFYDIQKGSIRIDEKDIRDVTISSLRGQVGTMLQDSFIFSGTIKDNIRYGNIEATDEQIVEAAKAVHAHDFIMQMEDGYHTELHERGSRLSVGQKQLIAFARTLLYDPAVLILDEATSSIDTETEKLLQKAINYILKDRTSIVIAHRLSTIKHADRIFVIDDGMLAESGTHRELLDKKGMYCNLYEAQYRKVLLSRA